MQSPAGYLCILLVVIAMIATPIAEKKLQEAKIARLTEIGVFVEQPSKKKKLTVQLRERLLKLEKLKAKKLEKKKLKEEKKKTKSKEKDEKDPPEVSG